MTTLKERFNAKFPFANYEAVYARLMRDNMEDYEKAVKFKELFEEASPPFSYIEEVGKIYVGSQPTLRYLAGNYDQDLLLGFDNERKMFYVYKLNVIFLYDSLEEYAQTLIERLIA